MPREVVIVAARRTAIGKFNGSLAEVPPHVLGASVIEQLLKDTGVPASAIDEVIGGQVLTALSGQNPARQAAVLAGIPNEVPAFTINKVCGSGLKAIHLAAQAIRAGDAEVVIAGGQENMSMAPHALSKSRSGQKMGPWNMQDTMVHDGLTDAFQKYHMGITAENVATKFGIDRLTQDKFANLSQAKAQDARAAGHFKQQIVPIKTKKGLFSVDEHLKYAKVEDLGRLKPAFKKGGTVTAGNASGINDGAAYVLVMSAEKAKELGLPHLARIVSYASAGLDPSIMGVGPVYASNLALKKAGWKHEELELIEANEAFAAQAAAVDKEMGWCTHKVNVNGGSIALGHPIGASGARIFVDMLWEMKRRGCRKGLATLCIGGGQGIACCVAVDEIPRSRL